VVFPLTVNIHWLVKQRKCNTNTYTPHTMSIISLL
jgi:hypothetical protein